MSRHPSPGPSQSLHYGQVLQASAPTHPSRQKSRAYATAVAAGAEDIKYQLKYKELKRKVKEIEADNDKLYFKVLQAKKNIQRMRLERAILYERLSSIPPSPEMRGRHPLPQHAMHPPHHPPPLSIPHPQQLVAHPRDALEHIQHLDAGDAYPEYVRAHEAARHAPGQDGRPMPAPEVIMGPGVAPPSHRQHMRHDSGHAHEIQRQLPTLPPLQLEQSRAAPGHAHPRSSHSHSHSGSSRSHSRSHSRSRGHQELPPPPMHPSGPGQPPQPVSTDTLPPLHTLPPPDLSPERRRYDYPPELTVSHSHSRTPPQLDLHSPGLAAPQSESQLPSPSTASSSRSLNMAGPGHVHNHQRVGPGANINRMHHRHSRRESEREREPEGLPPRVPTPPYAVRARQSSMRGEQPEQPERADVPAHSRSGSPVSAGARLSAGETLSRPGSNAQEVSHERQKSFGHRDPEQARDESSVRTALDSRKRSRDDMEVDGDNGAGASRETGENGDARNGGYASDDRRPKRVHPEDGSPASVHNEGERDQEGMQ